MISKLAVKMTEICCQEEIKDKEDRELYNYGFFMLISQLFFFILTFAMGMLLDIAVESILFYIVFTLLRTYAGGIHAHSETACMRYTSIAILTSVLFTKVFMTAKLDCIVAITTAFAAFIVFFLSPVESAEKPISQSEKAKYQTRVRVILFTVFLLTSLLCLTGYIRYVYPCATGILLEGVLVLLGKYKAVNG